jgi:hypothetical protein
MALFDSRAVATVLVGLLAILAAWVAAEAYVQYSSDVALAEFVVANTSSASEAGKSEAKGKTGCAVGKKELPNQLIPFR